MKIVHFCVRVEGLHRISSLPGVMVLILCLLLMPACASFAHHTSNNDDSATILPLDSSFLVGSLHKIKTVGSHQTGDAPLLIPLHSLPCLILPSQPCGLSEEKYHRWSKGSFS
ncbi:MAG TPA: hypothetical protein PK926_11045 [Spirochaetota bacterium]|nr:hypothetical protein [Spirochaetota bacterium]HPI88414.1 hypothetical protein [Spirochaetota bacterium]HPR49883.1 hypothetical protein [Spirochaetota bacterium]